MNKLKENEFYDFQNLIHLKDFIEETSENLRWNWDILSQYINPDKGEFSKMLKYLDKLADTASQKAYEYMEEE